MHKLLGRQLRRHIGDPDSVPLEFKAFLAAVDQSYAQSDNDRAMLEHSMETVSGELVDRFGRLKDALSDSQLAKEELNHAVSLLSATLDSTADGILVIDRSGKLVQMNRKFVELWRTPEAIIHSWFDEHGLAFVLEQVTGPSLFTQQIRDLDDQPDAQTFDALALNDGRILERYSVPQRIGDAIVGRVWSFRDVTERERAIAQGRTLAERFKSAFGDAPIGMTILAADGRWTEVNRAMCELLGRESNQLVGESMERFTHADDREPTRTAFERLRSGNERIVRMERRYIHSSGRVVWTVVNATLLADDQGEPFIISHVLDITEQREAEASVRRQALVFETMTEGVIVTGIDGHIVDVNPALQKMFGYTRDELLGQTPAIWQRSDVTPPALQTIREALRMTGEWSGEYGFVAKDGRTGVVESTITTLRDATGKPINAIGVTRDITERRQMDRQLLQAQKLEAMGSLAAGVAHEINTPTQFVSDNVHFIVEGLGALGAVWEQARILADAARTHPDLVNAVAVFDRAVVAADVGYLLEDLPRAAEQAGEGCDRISDIVKAMKGFSHPGGTHKQSVDLNAAVRDTVTVCRNEWKYVATMTTEFDATMPPVSCLPGELQQVVLNLIVNAAHAVAQSRGRSGELGHIGVTTRRDGAWAEIRVQDDGCGIPEAIQGKVFDPFFTTKRVGSGTGQGLAIGHATIVQKHEGMLTFESVEGAGTTFIIRIPLLGTGSETSHAA